MMTASTSWFLVVVLVQGTYRLCLNCLADDSAALYGFERARKKEEEKMRHLHTSTLNSLASDQVGGWMFSLRYHVPRFSYTHTHTQPDSADLVWLWCAGECRNPVAPPRRCAVLMKRYVCDRFGRDGVIYLSASMLVCCKFPFLRKFDCNRYMLSLFLCF